MGNKSIKNQNIANDCEKQLEVNKLLKQIEKIENEQLRIIEEYNLLEKKVGMLQEQWLSFSDSARRRYG